jgi:hypothetical protein
MPPAPDHHDSPGWGRCETYPCCHSPSPELEYLALNDCSSSGATFMIAHKGRHLWRNTIVANRLMNGVRSSLLKWRTGERWWRWMVYVNRWSEGNGKVSNWCLFIYFADTMITIIISGNSSPKAEIKNENVTPALKQTHTDESSAVQCKTFLRNSVFMITEIGVQVSDFNWDHLPPDIHLEP